MVIMFGYFTLGFHIYKHTHRGIVLSEFIILFTHVPRCSSTKDN